MINSIKKIRRVDILMFFILMTILIIVFRCFSLQYTDKKKYSNLISKFEIKEHVIKTSRGSIVDRNNVVLAESILLDSLIITNTKEFLKDTEAIKSLCDLLNKDYEELLKEIANRKIKVLHI